MNPQILFNSSLALLTTGLILLFKGIFVLGFASLIIAIGTSIVWLMSGFFDKDFLQNLIDYVLIIAILVLVCYYIYKTIQENKKTSPTVKPLPYDDTPNSSQRQELSKIEGVTTSSQITNAGFDSANDNALRLYCIKSSSNSAYTGGYMNLNMIFE